MTSGPAGQVSREARARERARIVGHLGTAAPSLPPATQPARLGYVRTPDVHDRAPDAPHRPPAAGDTCT